MSVPFANPNCIAAPLLSSVEDLHSKIESSTSFKIMFSLSRNHRIRKPSHKFSYQQLHISRLANLLLKHV
ncbi:hypothetical protein L1987_73505 [Smallanthus sonchifolius]|uniref:Uncharacterized protein n=1 Tax=Smallanthus sonchifolius TaxID=185202 RepID=A0ACB8ZZR9_9ASTR|nr:hypothetical protein L1987_73505 [Smallanthus sonchifolius]